MSRFSLILPLLLTLPGSGCAIVQVGVTNPIPGMSKVAIVPFFDQTPEPVTVLTPTPVVVVDGRRFAMAYFAELQKTPGFQVVPVGVTETAILENELDMGNSEDRRKLAELLDVDAIVIGAITDYDPYHPRMGLHVAWYSPRERTFRPGSPTEPLKRRLQRRSLRMEGKAHGQDLKAIRQAKAEAKRQAKAQEKAEAALIQECEVRGQSPDGHSEIRHSVFLSTDERTPILRPALYTADPSQRTYVRPVEGNSLTPPPRQQPADLAAAATSFATNFATDSNAAANAWHDGWAECGLCNRFSSHLIRVGVSRAGDVVYPLFRRD